MGQLRRRQVRSTVDMYQQWCLSVLLPSFPPSYRSIAGFLVMYVAQQHGSTRSLANVKSHVRVFCRLSDIAWLSESESARLLVLEKNLRYNDVTAANRKQPLTSAMLVSLAQMVRYRYDVVPLQLLTSLFVAHDGLLRGGELWSGIVVADVRWQWDKKGFVLHLSRTKTCRAGGGVTVTFAVAESLHQLSGVMLLRRWFDERRLWDQPDELVFPGFKEGKGGRFEEDGMKEGKKVVWVAYLRQVLKSMGCCEREFAGHSLRAGGATDLFNGGMALASVMKVGRWESVDSALVYFRDDLRIAKEAGATFAGCVMEKSLSGGRW